MCKETVPGILRFVSILFLIFEKGDKQESCARYFEIRKYAFLIFKKENKQKNLTMLFIIFEKGDVEKNFARYFEFHKYAFLIFEKGDVQNFEIRKYAFYNI